ncbi:taste receptor type 2 member 10-like [Pithys albifrons albifrons]|uniref:taste receptor type 2 member 10-like n=1 Tax=Pithys albifrons albifrons TaxID=3385563 RepID=UPI003A5CC341
MEACHSPEQSNVSSYIATIVAIITFETLAGMWINAFIASMLCMAWIKRKTLNSNEKILMLLGCSRFWYLCIAWIHSFLSALLLLLSLWRHKRNMQTNSMKDLSMDAHIKAIKTILSFLIMYSINFMCLILTIIYSAEKNENAMTFLVFVYLYAFPGIHSLVLIFSNPKLENTLLRILSSVKCKVCMR